MSSSSDTHHSSKELNYHWSLFGFNPCSSLHPSTALYVHSHQSTRTQHSYSTYLRDSCDHHHLSLPPPRLAEGSYVLTLLTIDLTYIPPHAPTPEGLHSDPELKSPVSRVGNRLFEVVCTYTAPSKSIWTSIGYLGPKLTPLRNPRVCC